MKKLALLWMFTLTQVAGVLFTSVSAQNLPDTLKKSSSRAITSYVEQVPDIIYPTPTSMALTKFVGYPVSHATGLIDISLPLYDMKLKHLNIPFRLQYHSSGIRLNDFPGIIGYGWSFSPGFKISRMIMGKPDDRYPVSYTSSDSSMPIQDIIKIAVPNNPGTQRPEEVDGQYDIFSLFLPQVSASFILLYQNNKYTVKMITEQPLKIVPLIDKTGNYMELYGFEVTDERGVKYYLGEASHYYLSDDNAYGYLEKPSNGSYSRIASGWMLRKIVQPNNDEINFNYKTNIEVDLRREDYCVIIDAGKTERRTANAEYDDYRTLTGELSFSVTNYLSSQYSNKSAKIPTTIEFKSGGTVTNKIEFGYKENPSTPIPATRFILESMKVYAGSNLIKTVSLTSKAPGLLTAVSISGEGRYQLSYNELFENEYKSETSKAMDWWGFYNGKVSNQTTIPQTNIQLAVPNQSWGWDMQTRAVGNADRTPDSLKMQAKVLNQIIYPTGGTFKINYGPHKYLTSKYGGGLRVNSTELYDPSSNKNTITRYVYEDTHYTAPIYPDASSYMKDLTLCGYVWETNTAGVIRSFITQRIRTITSISPYSYLSLDELPVWYGKVTVITNEENKSVYRYTTVADQFELFRVALDLTKEYAPYNFNRFLYKTPMLLEEQHYKKEGSTYTARQSVTNSYLIKDSTLTGLIALPYKQMNGPSMGNWEFLEEVGNSFIPLYSVFPNIITTKEYKLTYGSIQLASSLKQTTEQGKVITENTTYKYDAARPYNLTEKTIQDSNSGTLTEKYYFTNHTLPGAAYLTSAQKTAISQLDAANYRATVLQQTLEKNGQLLFGKLTGFRSLATPLLVPETTYEWRAGTYAASLQYPKYDSSGNLLYVTKDAQNIVYLWGYNRQYPIAEIKGCTYDDVIKAVSESALNTIALKAEPSETDWSTLKGLQTNSNLKGAHVTLYKYKPSVGVSETIAPNGLVTRYAYDSVGRLIEIAYLDGSTVKVLNTYMYNYKNN